MNNNIIAILRIKNEQRWIKKCLEHAEKICNGFIILDDGSTDDTISICKKFDSVLELHCQKGLPFDEVRDKNTLLNLAKKHNPDFLLSLDGDEIIQANSKHVLDDELNHLYSKSSIFEFQSLFIWDKPNQYRIDGVYSNIWYKRLMRMSDQENELYFQETPYPGNSHSTRLPSNCQDWNFPVRSKVKILHYGYYDQDMRKNKFEFYSQLDPHNADFDEYRHILGKGKFSGEQGIKLDFILNDMIDLTVF
jgi:O-antigen biosynthesis protein